MSSTQLFCPNIECPARGQVGKNNIDVHDQKKKRYICHVCERTFSASKGTLFYRLRTENSLIGDRSTGVWLSGAGDRPSL
jgi:transposase-like protein